MSEYTAEIVWTRGEQAFIDRRYSRRHHIRFDGGVEIAGSASPHVVRAPLSDPSAVDPEELFVASLSTCHMLWFLDLAARGGFVVDSYVDHVMGVMTKDSDGKLWISTATLRPTVKFSGVLLPTAAQFEALHHKAHEECFIARSVRTDVRVEPALA